MEQVFSYIISLGASVMMPILFTIIGLCIGMKFGKSLKSGLYVGVGFVGLGIVTALLTNNFGNPLSEISRLYDLQLGVFDMGWPAAAAVAYNTALIIPICLGVNFLLLITGCTRTVNIDLWNYWHFAFIGAVAYFVMGESLAWGYFAAIVCYIITLVMADLTADKFQGYYEDMDGISIPHAGRAYCAGCHRRCLDRCCGSVGYQEGTFPWCNDGCSDGTDSPYYQTLHRWFEAHR